MVSEWRRRQATSMEAGLRPKLLDHSKAARVPLAGNYAPLILSLQLDNESQAQFDRLRERYFPPILNIVPAHVTLFHHLPGEELPSILSFLQQVTAVQSPLPVQVTGLRSLGKGVAFTLESSALTSLRGRLAEEWQPWLTPQDRQRFKPHITVQNKVTPETARETLALLQASFKSYTATALGLHLWHYRNGPWEHIRTFSFSRS